MARKLTTKQRKLLDSYRVRYLFAGITIYTVDDLTDEHYRALEALNDYETLYQDANRYISDQALAERYA
jgi:hypothetical protein